MLATSQDGFTLPLVNPYGQPLRRRGRPSNASRVDNAREYTQGGTSSQLQYVNGFRDYEKLSGTVDDVDLTLGWDEKEKMDKDPFCAAALDTLFLGATARPLEIEPAPKSLYVSEDDAELADEVAAFIRRCMVYLKHTHRDINLTAFQIGRTAAKIGHAKAEIVSDLQRGGADDLKRVPVRVKSKSRRNSCFLVDRTMNVVGVAGYTGDYTDYADPYKISGMTLNGMLSASALGGGWVELPREKWLVVTNQPPEDDSPLGKSAYRAAYTAYRMKRDNWAFYLKSLDNTAMPSEWHNLPTHEYSGDTYPLIDGVPDTSADKVSMAEAMYQTAEEARQAGVGIYPHGTEHGALYTAASGDPFSTARNVYNSEITQAILLQSLATGTDRHMARAAGQVHQDILDLAMRHYRRMLCDSITRDLIAPLVKQNFPARYHHLIPQASFGEVELNDFTAWAEAFGKLATAGLLLPSQFPHIWAVLGLPQGSLRELQEQLDVDAAIQAKIMEDEVAADGTTQPGMYERNLEQEYSKRITRNIGQRRAGRTGVALS